MPVKKKVEDFDRTNYGCDFCSLKETWDSLRTPRMPVSGNTEGDILVLGEAPGRNEDEKGQIFIGASGRVLREEIPKSFEKRLAFQNTVRCRPPDNRTPTPREMHCCSIYLEADIERMPIKAILGCGGVPLNRFLPGETILKMHGTRCVVKVGGKAVWFYPVFHPSYVMRQDNDRNPPLVRPCFENDLKRFFAQVDKWREPEIVELSPEKVIVCRSRDYAEAMLAKMADPIAVDLETNMLEPYRFDAKILTAAFSDGNTTIAFGVNHPDWQNPWGMELLLKTVRERRWIAHNTAFELGWFRFNGPGDTFSNFEDTMALARLYHQRETILSLETQTCIHLGTNVKKVVNVDAKQINTYSLDQILIYNGLDAMATAPLYRILKPRVNEANYRRLLATIDTCTDMELKGLSVCLETAKTMDEHWEEASAAQVELVKQMPAVLAWERDTGKEFNIASPKQLGELLETYEDVELPRTEKGNRSTAKGVLAEVAEGNPLTKAILEYREAEKLRSTYIQHVLKVPQLYVDGQLHAAYTVLLVATGRLSSHSPNQQNWPRRRNGNTRNMVVAPPGFVFLAWDYAQLEARVLAMASMDRVLCEGIIKGRDIHADWRDNLLKLYFDYVYTVMEMHNLPSDVDDKTLLKAARDRVKNQWVFANFYGSHYTSCAESMRLPLQVAEQLAIQFWAEFRGVQKWLKAKRAEYQETGLMQTLTKRDRYQVLHKHNEPVNNPIQGTAADIVAESMNELTTLSRELNDPYLAPRIQVHDDITQIVPEAEVERYIELVHPILTKIRFPFQIVPLGVECKIGTTWGELDEVAVFTGDYIR